MEPDEAYDAARRCLEAHDFAGARDLLAPLPDDDLDACELRAGASYGLGDLEGCLTSWERVHRLLVEAGEPVGAARAACMVAMYLLIDTGLMAPIRGWLKRAESLLDPVEVAVPPHALVAMIRGYERFFCGDVVLAREHARRAVDLGHRLDVLPAVVMGGTCLARLDMLEGRVEDGLSALDEIAGLLMSGTVDPLTSGMAYCELICAAQGMLLVERAREWTEVMEHWSSDNAFGGLHGRCLVHRAELLRISGPGDVAERTAERALSSLRPWLRREFGWPLVELGAIRLRRGDLAGAEEALIAAHERAWCPMPALALLRLEQGEADEAAALIAEAIARPIEIPWKERPPISDLRLFPFYGAQCEIAEARGDRDTAAAAAAQMVRIAGEYPGPGVDAAAAMAVARTAVLDGDADTAVREASRAVAVWSETDAPFDVGQARLVLAAGHRLAGNEAGARLERQAAAKAFRTFGAPRWVARAEQGEASAPSGPRQEGSMVSNGTLLEIRFAGRTSVVRDLVGFGTLRRLLAEPGREFHVLDLVTARDEVRRPPAADAGAFTLEAGMPVIDAQARAAYKRQLAEIDDDIADAEAMNDLGRVELARCDREFLVHELAAAAGLGDRIRRTGDPAERARTSVTRSLRYAVAALAEQDPVAAEHLRLHLRTGVFCSYRPDPVAPITWMV